MLCSRILSEQVVNYANVVLEFDSIKTQPRCHCEYQIYDEN